MRSGDETAAHDPDSDLIRRHHLPPPASNPPTAPGGRSCGHSCGPARVVSSAVSGDRIASRMMQEGRHDGCYPDLESLPGKPGRWPGVDTRWRTKSWPSGRLSAVGIAERSGSAERWGRRPARRRPYRGRPSAHGSAQGEVTERCAMAHSRLSEALVVEGIPHAPCLGCPDLLIDL